MAAWADSKAIYETNPQARASIAEARERAAQLNKRVLIQWGADWCVWCHRLHAFLADDVEVREILGTGYEMVLVDTDTNRALMEEMGVKPRGLPYLTVLDAAGTTLAAQDTHVFQSASRFDRDKVIPFLKQWLPPAKEKAEETAETLVAAALKAAVKDGKGVFVSIGAEWCGWCKRLDALLANEIVGPIMRERFVLLKLDQEKVAGTKEFRAGHGSELSGGIPWYAALDATGEVVATSDAKAGNTGYPAKPEEIDWFMDVIKRSAPGMDPAKAAQLEAEVRRIGQELVPN
jgi:thiol:disulfide interchange protein